MKFSSVRIFALGKNILLLAAASLWLSDACTARACPDTLWSRTQGTVNFDVVTGMTSSPDGNFILCGYIDQISVQRGSGWIAKITPAGDTLWTRRFGGSGGDDIFHDVQRVPTGGYICAGITRTYAVTPPQQDFWLVRVSENGDSLWSNAFGGQFAEQGVAVVPMLDGGFLVAGRTNSFGAGGFDWWVVKTDQNGDSLWSRTFGGSTEDGCNDAIQLADGRIVLCGYETYSPPASYQAQVLMLSANGDSLWSRFLGGPGIDRFEAVRPGPAGSLLLAGRGSYLDSQAGDIWMVRMSTGGDSLGSFLFGDDDPELAYDVVYVADGEIYLFGQTDTVANGVTDVWIVKTNIDGDCLWSSYFGGSGSEYCFAGLLLADRSLLLAGATTTNAAGQRDLWWLRTTPDNCNNAPARPLRVAPPDSAVLDEQTMFTVNWTRSRDQDQDPVTYIFHLDHTYMPDGIFPVDTVTADTFVNCTVFLTLNPLDELFDFHWKVWATDGQDTVEARNGEGFFQMNIIVSADPAEYTPQTFDLSVYPNPFNNSATISFSLPKSEWVTLSVFTLEGRLAAKLIDAFTVAGPHRLSFDARTMSSGVYLVHFDTPTLRQTQKLLLLK